MPKQDSLQPEIIALSAAIAAGVVGGFSAWAGAYGLGGIFMGLMGLAIFVIVIPGIAAKLNPTAQAVPAATLLIFGLWMMATVGHLSGLGVLGLAIALAWLLLPFVLIPMGGRNLQPHQQ